MSLQPHVRAVLAGVAATVIAALGTAAYLDSRDDAAEIADPRPGPSGQAAPPLRVGARAPRSAPLQPDAPATADVAGDAAAATDSSAVPPRPAAMTTPDREGAIAAAEYFLELSNAIYLSGDTTAWDELASPDCVWCQRISDATRAAAARYPDRSGGARDAGVLETVAQDEPARRWSFLVGVHTEASASKDASGVPFLDLGGDVVSGIDLGFEDGDWVVYDLVPEVELQAAR